MITDFDELLGTGKIAATETELIGAIDTMPDDDLIEAMEEEPEVLGQFLTMALMRRRKKKKFMRKLKGMSKAKKRRLWKAHLKKTRKKRKKKRRRGALLTFLPISPVGKLALHLAMKRKRKKKRLAAKKRAAAKRKAEQRPQPIYREEQPPQPVYTPPAPVYQEQRLTPESLEPDEPAEQPEGGKQPFNIKKILPLAAIAAGALFLLPKKKK